MEGSHDLRAFQYEPLPDDDRSMRLLSLESGDFEDDIHCACQAFDLDSAPTYHAISYVWGDPSPKRKININGCAMLVGENCWYALRQARHLRPRSHIWVDAICIDQNAVGEKGRQVAMMGDIYGRASSVLVCIGSHADDSRFFYERVPLEYELYTPGDHRMIMLGTPKWGRMEELCQQSFAPHELFRARKTICSLADRPYFRRLWTIQEMYKARQALLCCGQDEVALMAFFDYAYAVALDSRGLLGDMELETYHRKTSNVRELYISQRHESSLYDNFTAFRSFDCSDPRDKIYAILAITRKPLGARSILPKYDCRLTDLVAEALRYERIWIDVMTKALLDVFGLGPHHAEVQSLIDDRQMHRSAELPKLVQGVNQTHVLGVREYFRLESLDQMGDALYVPDMELRPDDAYGSSTPIMISEEMVEALCTEYTARENLPKKATVDRVRRDLDRKTSAEVLVTEIQQIREVPTSRKCALLLCSAARDDDLVVELDDSYFLVARKRGRRLEMIGQAFVVSHGDGPNLKMKQKDTPYGRDHFRPPKLEVVFDAHDLMTLVCLQTYASTLEEVRIALSTRICHIEGSSYLRECAMDETDEWSHRFLANQ